MLGRQADGPSCEVRAITGVHITNCGTRIAGMQSIVPALNRLAYHCAGGARIPDPEEFRPQVHQRESRYTVSIRSGPPCRAWVRVRSIRVCWIDLDRAHVWTQSFRAYGGGQYAPVLGGLGEARHCRRGAADHEFDLFGGAPARDHPEPSVSVAARTSAAGAVRRTPARSGLCPACAAFSR